MRRQLVKRLLSMENEEVLPVEGEASQQDVEIAQQGAELAEAVAEVNESETIGEVLDEQIDEGQDVVESLESLRMIMADSAKATGFSRDAAAVTSLHQDFVMSRLGASSYAKIASLESFGAATSRVRSTQLSMEQIGQNLKDIWKAIVEKVKAAFRWVKEHFQKVFGYAERLVKRADALKEKAESVASSGMKAEETKFDNANLVKKLYVAGAFPTNMAAVAKDVAVKIPAYLTYATSAAPKLETALEAGLKWAAAGDAAGASAESFSLDANVIAAPTDFDAAGAKATPGNAELNSVVVSKELPGNTAVFVTIPVAGKTGEEALAALSNVHANVGTFDSAKKAPTNVSVSTLTSTDALSVANEVSTLATALVQYRKGRETAEKAAVAVERALDSFVRDYSKDDNAEKQKSSTTAKKLAGKVAKIMDMGSSKVVAYALTTGNAMLDYVDLSLRQYKKA